MKHLEEVGRTQHLAQTKSDVKNRRRLHCTLFTKNALTKAESLKTGHMASLNAFKPHPGWSFMTKPSINTRSSHGLMLIDL